MLIHIQVKAVLIMRVFFVRASVYVVWSVFVAWSVFVTAAGMLVRTPMFVTVVGIFVRAPVVVLRSMRMRMGKRVYSMSILTWSNSSVAAVIL